MAKKDKSDGSQARIDDALNRLEKAVAARLQAPGGNGDDGGEDVRKLTAELAASNARNQSLEERTATVSQRLDQTVQRLKTILED